METATATARLVEASELESGVTAVLPRAEVEQAARSDEAKDLFLDVARADESTTISVSWSRDDLERLLAQTSGSEITLTFDQSALAQALEEPEVEGHGFRERALILTVAAATAAGATAGAAAAGNLMPSGERMATAQAGQIGGAVGAAGDQAPAAVTGGAGVINVQGGAVGASGMESPAETTGGPGVLEHTGGAIGGAGMDTPAQSTGGAGIETPAPTGSGSSFDVPSPDPGTAALVGLAGLGAVAITAAGFAARRRGTTRPA